MDGALSSTLRLPPGLATLATLSWAVMVNERGASTFVLACVASRLNCQFGELKVPGTVVPPTLRTGLLAFEVSRPEPLSVMVAFTTMMFAPPAASVRAYQVASRSEE